MLAIGNELRTANRRNVEAEQSIHAEFRIVAPTVEDCDVGIGEPHINGRTLSDVLPSPCPRLPQSRGYAHVKLGMAFEKAMQPGHQPTGGKRRRHADGQLARASVRPQLLDGLSQALEAILELG